MSAPLSSDLLEILVCAESKKPLVYFEADSILYCPESRLKYRIDDGIPVMLVEDAERVDAAEADRLMAQAEKLGLV